MFVTFWCLWVALGAFVFLIVEFRGTVGAIVRDNIPVMEALLLCTPATVGVRRGALWRRLLVPVLAILLAVFVQFRPSLSICISSIYLCTENVTALCCCARLASRNHLPIPLLYFRNHLHLIWVVYDEFSLGLAFVWQPTPSVRNYFALRCYCGDFVVVFLYG